MAFLLASASGQLIAETSVDAQMNNLLNSSGVIRTQFDTTLRTLYGAEDLSHSGGLIPMNDFLEAGKLTQADVSSYNQAVNEFRAAKVQSILGAYIDGEAESADMQMHSAVDDFVLASSAVLEVVKLNEMTGNALSAGDVETAQSLQDYSVANGVELTTEEVTAFNTSVDTVEDAVLTYAAFQTVASDATLKADLEQAAADIQGTADQATAMFYDTATNNVGITFAQTTDTQTNFVNASIDVSSLVALDNDAYLTAGNDNPFYINGPTQSAACLLNTTDLVSCTQRQSYQGPPPNQLLYRDMDGDGVMDIFAYTDENGAVIEYQEGDTVINPQNGEVIGTFENGYVTCNAGYETYCA